MSQESNDVLTTGCSLKHQVDRPSITLVYRKRAMKFEAADSKVDLTVKQKMRQAVNVDDLEAWGSDERSRRKRSQTGMIYCNRFVLFSAITYFFIFCIQYLEL